MEIKITKAKLTKGRTCEIELTEILDDSTENEVVKKCSQLAHNDLVNAFKRLKIHFVKLLELKEGDKLTTDQNYTTDDILLFDPENDLENFEVASFSIGGSSDSEGVTLSGNKRLASGKVLNFNTAFIKFEDEAEYAQVNELAADIEAIKIEVNEYLNGKYAVKQLEIDFEGEGEEMNEAPKEEKKRGKKKETKTVYMIPEDEKPAYAEM